MNAYRAVIAGTLILALLTVVLFWVLNDTGATILGAALLIALMLADWGASLYILSLVRRDRRRPRSWLLLFLVTGSFMITVGLSVTLFVLTRRLFGLPALDAGLGLRLVAIGQITIGFVPAMKAALFFLVQRDPTANPAGRREDPAA